MQLNMRAQESCPWLSEIFTLDTERLLISLMFRALVLQIAENQTEGALQAGDGQGFLRTSRTNPIKPIPEENPITRAEGSLDALMLKP